jgi:hypothetical protein
VLRAKYRRAFKIPRSRETFRSSVATSTGRRRRCASGCRVATAPRKLCALDLNVNFHANDAHNGPLLQLYFNSYIFIFLELVLPQLSNKFFAKFMVKRSLHLTSLCLLTRSLYFMLSPNNACSFSTHSNSFIRMSYASKGNQLRLRSINDTRRLEIIG